MRPDPRRRRLIVILVVCAFGAAAMVAANADDIILYNPSPSMPVGFYVRSDAPITIGAIVTVRARDVAEAYALGRNFTDSGDRFIKRVVATSSDHVCVVGSRIVLNGIVVATRASVDTAGAALPQWTECRPLAADEVFLMGESDDSFDSRYWGPVPRSQIEGVWRPL
ncbi:S26 family signal peptidase [Terricaulis silvestris]|uniref:Signal peptidase I n=1 Tax=Terricaulis silvestris TaxID=2686094 RepID=A0A6I6MUR5_9CAUL|nr:S26 family signal peptidase [Terricaulis silvestris]QGZ94913.1 conjugal transfer peptidase TraF [Terricaulis silvestris]